MEDILKQLKSLTDRMNEHIHNNIDGTTPLRSFVPVIASLPTTQPQTAANFGIFFVATKPCYVKAISEVHTVAGNDAGAVTLQVERLQGTEALDAGDPLLLTAFDLKGTANTVQRGALVKSNKTLLSLQLGDRLALKDAGTLTTLQGVCITVELQF